MNETALFGGLVFGAIGFAAFVYGKKQGSWKPMAIGILLTVFPYFVSNGLALIAIGTVLTVALFIFRD